MGYKHNKRDGLHTFNCDGQGCHRNFEGDEGTDFRAAWHQARGDGWVNSEHRGTWQHFCPVHAKELGD